MEKKGKKENKKQKEEPEPVEEKKEEKPFTFWDIKRGILMLVHIEIPIDGLKHLFLENNVSDLVKSPDKKKSLVEFFTAYYEKQGLKDQLENNELTILADYHFYNFEFAKDQLLLPDDKAALLMNIFATFVSFQHLQKERDPNAPRIDVTNEEKCKEVLAQKYDYLKETLILFAVENPPSSLKVFTAEQIDKILGYATSNYFKHFKLYSYALSIKQSVAEKKMLLYIDEARPVPSLKDALLKDKEGKEMQKTGRLDPKQSSSDVNKKEDKSDVPREEKKKAEKKEDEEKNVDKMIETINLSNEGKQALYSKIKEMKDEIDTQLQERQKKMAEKLEEMKGGKGKPPAKKAK